MADKVYPSRTPANATNPAFPSTKAQIYSSNRPVYRPGARGYRSRNCCRTFCCCLFLTLLTLIIALAVASTVIYLVYRPHRPAFSVTSLKLSTFSISSSTLTSQFNLNITARNPNKKIIYYYNPTTISIYTSDNIDIGDGSLPSFVHGTKNTTLLSASIASHGQQLDSGSITTLKAEAKSSTGLPLEVHLDTKVKVKMGSLKTPKVGIRITCDGIRVRVPSGNSTATASTAGASCKVHSRIKIWKWTV